MKSINILDEISDGKLYDITKAKNAGFIGKTFENCS